MTSSSQNKGVKELILPLNTSPLFRATDLIKRGAGGAGCGHAHRSMARAAHTWPMALCRYLWETRHAHPALVTDKQR
ncbi:unnamed protein product [Leptosia nina]|uniref:Uncharacterized protein n=1 Tax=Leptosia nina TaxID=320188 RepID=A0AAV1J4Y9_9NEOP